ncbi:flagellar basal body L-ring protein FlgH [Salipiger bermudensis]|uniref:flagellar basal body L-ring protein FlgH n=1 Tax=Salipiger bermudensis TaxID=344736 RepID=UPI001CD20781|nr:flagellar basal body L-ring protein FlgH [Salipiger bermudensis]MCA0962608.1 flagellar basal body L-ring protein FlgH [Salipiger bermudensis]
MPCRHLCLLGFLFLLGCSRLDHLGKAPSFTPQEQSPERLAMAYSGIPTVALPERRTDRASLWSRERGSLLGDRRAMKRGDILTVVIEIDDEASISNSTSRSRSGSESLSVPQLLGIPQRIDEDLPLGATMADAVDLGGQSASGGDGQVARSEELTLRVAATITDVMPNGVLAIEGAQEVRVNFELRELLVSGFVRPEDITRQNEITYDKIASAKISYGGRGQISDMQQPRYGQQVLDMILPF